MVEDTVDAAVLNIELVKGDPDVVVTGHSDGPGVVGVVRVHVGVEGRRDLSGVTANLPTIHCG